MTNASTNKWWGYVHQNGSVHAKRYFDRRDIQEAMESPFVAEVYPPFDAESRPAALDLITKRVSRSRRKELQR